MSFAMELADQADKIAMRYFRRDLRIDRKPDRTFVTQADTAVERTLREQIEHRYPQHG
ncbi:MAG: histidinol phosphatase, partial [Chloroflexi bacterium]